MGYVKLRVAHAPGMPGTFSPRPWVSVPHMHHGTCVTHVPRCMPGTLANGLLWSRWRGKRSRHSRRMCNPRFCVSGKRLMMLIYAHFNHIRIKRLLQKYYKKMKLKMSSAIWRPFCLGLNVLRILLSSTFACDIMTNWLVVSRAVHHLILL